ncbi:MAG: hypothetical protein JNJ57_07430 [Saprospiraceae bacterium]|nr:hypothetical protein [Saprospiraceae bacterium]
MVATISDENLKQYWISLTTKSNNTPLFVQNESFASIETLELNIPFIVNGFTEKTALVLTIIAEDHAGNPKSEQTLEFFFEP